LGCDAAEAHRVWIAEMKASSMAMIVLLTLGQALGFYVQRRLERRGISLFDRRTRKTALEMLLSVAGCWGLLSICIGLLVMA
jgi:hypothetical protein